MSVEPHRYIEFKAVGDAIRIIRLILGIKLDEMVEKTKLTKPRLLKIENGIGTPDSSSLMRIAAVLGVPLNGIFILSERLEWDGERGVIRFLTRL